ncbi:hypothetical protein Scep_019722 [Stephania cephalantha]|uniref:Uncharacterized protein n=1 Tax=Stephania cephalantha TaxID=152367 RepID=A0AAP0IBQ2_9MAGN
MRKGRKEKESREEWLQNHIVFAGIGLMPLQIVLMRSHVSNATRADKAKNQDMVEKAVKKEKLKKVYMSDSDLSGSKDE